MIAYEVKAGTGVIAGITLCDPCVCALRVYYRNERYINTLTFLYLYLFVGSKYCTLNNTDWSLNASKKSLVCVEFVMNY